MRISRDAWAMELAQVTARRSTCLRRSVGCVLLNARGHVLATGYNGVAAGMPHCNERELCGRVDCRDEECRGHPHACLGASAPSGTQLEACEAIHAECNACLQCRDVWALEACYVTVSPCVSCVKLLLNTSTQRVVFAEPYAHDAQAKELWTRAGRLWVPLNA